MAERLPKDTAFLWVFKAYLLSTGQEATGKTIAVTLAKNGATSFSNPGTGALNATEMASGWYKASLGTGDFDTLGPIALRGAESSIYDVGERFTVVSANNNGLLSLPDTNYIGKSGAAIGRGTVTSGASTTSVPTSALAIGGAAATGVVANQFASRAILFDGDTTTAGLRGASSTISANTASNTPTLTVGTLPATPASGDTFSII